MAVLARPELTAGAKATAARLQGHMNMTTGQINPAARKLGEETCQTERATEKHLAAIKGIGFLDWSGSKGRTSNRYRLLFPTPNGGPGSHLANPEPPGMVGPKITPNSGAGSVIATPNNEAYNPEREGEQPRPVVRTNLVLTQPVNLTAAGSLNDLRAQLRRPTKDWLWRGAVFEPPQTIVFASRHFCDTARDLHSQEFEELKITARWRNAA